LNGNNNLKILFGILLMFLLIISQASNVTAANNQGLEWGLGVDDRLDYDVKVEYHNTTLDLEFDDEMYVIVNSVPSISDDITSLTQITTFNMIFGHYTTYWENGSIMDSLWRNTLKLNPIWVLPVGNWVLVTELFVAATPTAIMVQDSEIFNSTIEDIPNPGNVQSTELLKSDGATSSWVYNVTWGSETTVYVELTRQISTTTTTTTTTSGTTTGTGQPLDDTTLLIITGGVGVVAVVLIVVILRKR
jgi:hypothetical protein